MKKKLLFLLLDFTDWCLRIYVNEPTWYEKGYFINGIKEGIEHKEKLLSSHRLVKEEKG